MKQQFLLLAGILFAGLSACPQTKRNLFRLRKTSGKLVEVLLCKNILPSDKMNTWQGSRNSGILLNDLVHYVANSAYGRSNYSQFQVRYRTSPNV